MDKRRLWSDEEIEFLKEHYPKVTNNSLLGKILKRQPSAIASYAKKMGLSKIHKRSNHYYFYDIYTLYKGEEYITDGTISEIAEHLGVTIPTVMHYKKKSRIKRLKTNNAYNVVFLYNELEEEYLKEL